MIDMTINWKNLAVGLACSLCISPLTLAQSGEDLLVKDETGTDPRDFSDKFMPYYRYTELENGLEVDELALFGMHAFKPTLAMTYEIPVYKKQDISEPKKSLPFDPNVEDYWEGMGDTNLRLFAPIGRWANMTWLAGAELWLPTHTEDALGDERVNLAPMVANIMDLDMLPMPGAFMAMMHFAEFTVWKNEDVNVIRPDSSGLPTGIPAPESIEIQEDLDTARYKGRWFFMIPLNKKYKLYTLTEMQPIYDFRASDFSFWIGPEFGTAYFGPLIYIKPGWGIENSSEFDRDFSLEIGMRIMDF
jgi:hypothetical protein